MKITIEITDEQWAAFCRQAEAAGQLGIQWSAHKEVEAAAQLRAEIIIAREAIERGDEP